MHPVDMTKEIYLNPRRIAVNVVGVVDERESFTLCFPGSLVRNRRASTRLLLLLCFVSRLHYSFFSWVLIVSAMPFFNHLAILIT
jgi:hypothetical protein